MFESLQEGLQSALKTLQGKARLTEANMRDGLRLVQQSLLEADVSYPVVKDFMDRVSQEALGTKVLNALDPTKQLLGIVYQAMADMMGPVDASLHLKRDEITVLMLCGLQGSGKTTTCGKLARNIMQAGRKPMLVAADLQRPGAVDQLAILGEQIGVPVYREPGATDPVKLCRAAAEQARREGVDVCILDTAGRLAIDEELMEQLRRIDRQVQPDQIYLVVDGMTGQDAVNSAGAFNEALELDGVIMTKLDGDARGGAVLSVKHVTGVPIKFIGTGEHLNALEPFNPQGMASRILGHGDILELVRTAQTEFDQQEMVRAEERLRRGEFTLDDFRKQLAQIARPGLMQKMLGLLPGMGEITKMMQNEDAEGTMRRLFGVIDSMTPWERSNPTRIDQSRRRRIAAGSGTQPHEVNDLLKQFDAMASIMKQMAGGGIRERMQMVRQLQQGGALGPGGQLQKQKKGTGKRLSSKERADRAKKLKGKLKKFKKRK